MVIELPFIDDDTICFPVISKISIVPFPVTPDNSKLINVEVGLGLIIKSVVAGILQGSFPSN